MGYNGYTEKKKASNERYLSKLSNIVLRMKPDYKELIDRASEQRGLSRNAFILQAIEEKIQREKTD